MLSKEDEAIVRGKCLELAKKSLSLNQLSGEEINYLVKKLIELKGEKLAKRKERKIERGWREDPFDTYLEIIFEGIEDFLNKTKISDNKKALAYYFDKMELERQLGEIESKTLDLKLGERKEAKKLNDELNQLIKHIREEDPELGEALAPRINEISGDIMAIESDGIRGSIRKLRQIEEQK
ncbi:MAG: hypothetical protein ABII71_05655, partial [Candidatus Micrarchaeota archaeon]